jgi:hypothetical protein
MTAVEWLENQLAIFWDEEDSKAIIEALKMERNQIIQAMKEAKKSTFHQQYDSVEEYYDKMIKK